MKIAVLVILAALFVTLIAVPVMMLTYHAIGLTQYVWHVVRHRRVA